MFTTTGLIGAEFSCANAGTLRHAHNMARLAIDFTAVTSCGAGFNDPLMTLAQEAKEIVTALSTCY
jgi:hypothetical protein